MTSTNIFENTEFYSLKVSSIHCLCVPHFLYAFSIRLTLRLSLFLGYCEYCAINTGEQVPLIKKCLLPTCGYAHRDLIARSYSGSFVCFMWNVHTTLYNGCANLHFYQQCARLPPFSMFIGNI